MASSDGYPDRKIYDIPSITIISDKINKDVCAQATTGAFKILWAFFCRFPFAKELSRNNLSHLFFGWDDIVSMIVRIK